MSRLSKTALIAAAIALCAGPAFAHSGHEFGHTALQGFLHPLSGIDHVIAMIAIGLLAFCLGGRAIWTVPLAFVLMMAVGAVLGATGLGLPGVEQGIAASVLVLGMLIVVATRLSLIFATVLAGAFAVFHGTAHGLESAMAGIVTSYFLGFLLATVMLHCAGIALGAAFAATENRNLLQRAAGTVVGLTGLMMIVG
jgi:urease accessory protein